MAGRRRSPIRGMPRLFLPTASGRFRRPSRLHFRLGWPSLLDVPSGLRRRRRSGDRDDCGGLRGSGTRRGSSSPPFCLRLRFPPSRPGRSGARTARARLIGSMRDSRRRCASVRTPWRPSMGRRCALRARSRSRALCSVLSRDTTGQPSRALPHIETMFRSASAPRARRRRPRTSGRSSAPLR